MYEYFACMEVCVPCVCLVPLEIRNTGKILELELHIVVSYPEGAGNQIQILRRAGNAPDTDISAAVLPYSYFPFVKQSTVNLKVSYLIRIITMNNNDISHVSTIFEPQVFNLSFFARS